MVHFYFPNENPEQISSKDSQKVTSYLFLGYEKTSYTSNTLEKEETPFLSNFTKRLSSLSTDKKTDEYKNDIIKEHDTNGASSYVRSSLTR